MLILHAGLKDDGFVFWAEKSPEKYLMPTSVQGRKNVKFGVCKNPFDAGKAGLDQFFPRSISRLAPIGRPHLVPILLPTKNCIPVPSSPLIAATDPDDERETSLEPWLVSAMELNYGSVVDCLCFFMDRHMVSPGAILGNEIAFWCDVVRWTALLVKRQRFIPAIIEESGQYCARWEPIFTGHDLRQLEDFSRRIPPVSLAFSAQDGALPSGVTPERLLRSFVMHSLDYMVREGAHNSNSQSFFPHHITSDTATLHDLWLYALLAKEAELNGNKRDLTGLVRQVREWRRPLAVSVESPVRLCFRLEEPEDHNHQEEQDSQADSDWYVRYLLQSREDPSLIVPLPDVWKDQGSVLRHLKLKKTALRENILASLGHAASLCTHIASSLKARIPAGYTLDESGAYQFLMEKALALEETGFGVMLPAWWTNRGTKARLSIRARVNSPKMPSAGVISLNQIIRFQWEAALGDHELSLQELQTLASLKAPLVKIRGQWVEVRTQDIHEAMTLMKKKAGGQATLRDILLMSIGAGETAKGLTVESVQTTGWIRDLQSQIEGSKPFDELEMPDGFRGVLRPYQLRGYSWLAFLRQWGLGACLADDMGLGKTIQTLALVQREWSAGRKRPALLVCPTSVVNNWKKEIERFTPGLPVMIHHGVARKKEDAFIKEAVKCAFVISSYGLLHRDLTLMQEVEWAAVILDEAQNVKNPHTAQSRAARALKADFRVALTGTPVENNVGDLWSIMEFLNPGLLGSQSDFKSRFFVPIQAMQDQRAANLLKRITGPFILRRLKTDKTIISDLPDKLEMKVYCNLTKEQASLYAAVVKDVEETLQSAEGIQRKGLILSTLSRLKQVCNHPAQFLGDNSRIHDRSGKLNRLVEMLEEIFEEGDRALVFTQFAEMGAILHKYLQETFGRDMFYLYGGTPRSQRDRMVEQFQTAKNAPPVFILSLKAGGTGLNLTGAGRVFHFDRWWNPAVENQATDRAFRIGQTRNVQVYKYICAGTLEERIDEMIEKKKGIADQVVGSGEGWLTSLSNKELKEIFALRRDAVVD